MLEVYVTVTKRASQIIWKLSQTVSFDRRAIPHTTVGKRTQVCDFTLPQHLYTSNVAAVATVDIMTSQSRHVQICVQITAAVLTMNEQIFQHSGNTRPCKSTYIIDPTRFNHMTKMIKHSKVFQREIWGFNPLFHLQNFSQWCVYKSTVPVLTPFPFKAEIFRKRMND